MSANFLCKVDKTAVVLQRNKVFIMKHDIMSATGKAPKRPQSNWFM